MPTIEEAAIAQAEWALEKLRQVEAERDELYAIRARLQVERDSWRADATELRRCEEENLSLQAERDRLREALTRLAHPAGPPPREEAAALYEMEVQQIAREALGER